MIGTATHTHRADDLIDALLTATGDEVLSPPTSHHGEWDAYFTMLTPRDRNRLSCAGLISRHGMPADRLASHADWQGNADTFVAWYLDMALRGLNARQGIRDGQRERCEPEPAALPESLALYLARLLCEGKRQHAAACVLALIEHQPMPECSSPWARNVESKVQRYLNRKAP